ncbi:uncharacterized protein CCR75_003320 [Bremia lactucae]|uniref:Uncharacterized protein n=1 Tax=Bremia lactucae TaxID=4779 RepID=A0A976ILD7_BRELC|nr:hypothetical protein CCR75_003317 [Bremia lactucae]TDH73982.1 hypothetical protein CCR75_003320 [Bremia lactucae]
MAADSPIAPGFLEETCSLTLSLSEMAEQVGASFRMLGKIPQHFASEDRCLFREAATGLVIAVVDGARVYLMTRHPLSQTRCPQY